MLANFKRWYTPCEALKMATHDNAGLIKMCEPRDPYPGQIGVVKEGALVDILLVNGDPIKDISILTKPEENLAMIMKDGKIYKNTIN